MHRFIVFDYQDKYVQAKKNLGKWIAAGKIKYREDLVRGLDNAPSALQRLFSGKNIGKVVVQVSDAPSSPALRSKL